MIFSKRNLKMGFTLVELLVTISIFVILTGIVLFKQSSFDSSIMLSNLAYDVALTIRQAQNYGINIKEFGEGQFVPYGVHFDLDSPKSFILFADLSYDKTANTSDGLYRKVDSGTINKSTLATCDASLGCVKRYNIQRGNYISYICVDDCSSFGSNGSRDSIDITFRRPNPDAIILDMIDTTHPHSFAKIELSSLDGSTQKCVEVWKNGLIQANPGTCGRPSEEPPGVF